MNVPKGGIDAGKVRQFGNKEIYESEIGVPEAAYRLGITPQEARKLLGKSKATWAEILRKLDEPIRSQTTR